MNKLLEGVTWTKVIVSWVVLLLLFFLVSLYDLLATMLNQPLPLHSEVVYFSLAITEVVNVILFSLALIHFVSIRKTQKVSLTLLALPTLLFALILMFGLAGLTNL